MFLFHLAALDKKEQKKDLILFNNWPIKIFNDANFLKTSTLALDIRWVFSTSEAEAAVF